MLYKFMLGAGYIVENKFNRDTKDAFKINDSVLKKILQKNANSQIGREYKFNLIKTIEEFKREFPLTEYKFYEEYIERMCQGEENVLVSEKIDYFGHTSGTTGKQKLIPVTKTSRQVASKYMAFLINKFAYNRFKSKWNYGKGLLISDIVMTTYTEGGVPICSATSGGMKSMKPLLSYLYTSPIEVMEIKDKEVALYLHLLFALEERNLLYISGVFISNILDLFRTLEKNYELLIRDIRKGSINRKLNIDEEKRKKIKGYIEPNPTVADELEQEFKKGFKGIAKRIWPRLSYIATVTGANFSIYDNKVKYYTEDLDIYSPVYAATEATIGINPYINKIKYVVIPDTVFYEFIPIDNIECENPDTLNINQLNIGEIYEIVVTNYSGLYRYMIGDVVRVVDFYNNSPCIEFLYRKNQVLNMVSEKTTENHLTNAIRNSIYKLNIDIVDYTTIPDNSITPGRYVFYMELHRNMSVKIEEFEETLDKELRISNLAYDRARCNRKLAQLKIKLLKYDTFNNIKDLLFKKGVSKNQIKIPRVAINNKIIVKVLKDNII